MSDSIPKLIFDTTLYLLEEIGVRCTDQRIIDTFESTYLAAYDYTTKRIHILKDLVRYCLETLPRKSKFPVPDKSFGNGGIAAYIHQGDDYIVPDVNIHVAEIAKMAEEFNHPFLFKGAGAPHTNYEDFKQIIIMRRYFSGYLYVRVETEQGINKCAIENERNGNICSCHSILNSPLYFNETGNNIDIFFDCVKRNIPLYLTTMPITCVTGPTTIYGISILAFAEFLAGMCLAQILNPGITVVNGAYPSASNPIKGYRIELGSIFHNYVNHIVSRISDLLDIPSIQSGCTITGKEHNPEKESTDFETERGFRFWNSINSWHQVRHCFGFVNQLIAYDLNKMRRDCKVHKRVIENDEKFDYELEEILHDEEAFQAISDCAGIMNFMNHNHTLKNMGIIE